MISHRLSRLYGVLGAICLILSCTFVSAEDRNDWQQPDRWGKGYRIFSDDLYIKIGWHQGDRNLET